MKVSISVLLAAVLQYAQAAQPTAYTQSRCLTALTSKSGIVTTTTTALTLTFRPPVVYTLTPSTIVTPAASTSKYSWLLDTTPESMFYKYQPHSIKPDQNIHSLSLKNDSSRCSFVNMANTNNAAATTTTTLFTTSTLPAPTSTTTYTETDSTTGKHDNKSENSYVH